MNLYYKININREKVSNYFYLEKLKIIGELLFFICLLLEIVYILKLTELITDYIYLLNYIFIKYICWTKERQIITDEFINYREIDVINYLLIFFDKEEMGEESKEKEEYKQKIIFCKKVSRTRKKGRVYRYKVIMITYSTSSSWFGLGKAKDFFLQNAVYKARINSFKNIFSINSGNSKNLENIYTKEIGHQSFLKNLKWNALPSSLFCIRTIIQSLKKMNLSIKMDKSNTIFRIINSLI